MKKHLLIITSFLWLTGSAFSQSEDMRAFALFDSSGTEMDYSSVLSKAEEYDVVLFGEHHNSAVIHWLQLRMLKGLHQGSKKVQLGGEFFERDDQLIIDEYLSGLYDSKKLISESKEWPNFETDYLPMFEFAKENDISCYATNVPRRYASVVAKKGIDSLKIKTSKSAKSLFAKIPFEFDYTIPGYADILDMMGGHGQGASSENFVKAQAIKDATMAETILEVKDKGGVFLHVNGDFHSANYGGIYWYLKNGDKNLKVLTIKVYEAENFDFSDEWKGSGDIILVVPSDFTKTH